MSAEEDTPKPSSRDESSDTGGSDSDASSEDEPKVEWLATGRAKRSTAGNRMKTMLAEEEPDSDLELLFAEDDDDAGFEDVEDDASDVQMDSSSDDEDEQNAADELEGEKELQREARERRAAARKRKAQEAIPAKFRKKVRIQPTGLTQAPAPAPRPRKKSERLSWLPSEADAPTRASSRRTTRMSKEQLHQQMKEREARRLKQLALMEKKAAQMEARKKPPMTQEQRLAEAALVEKRNSKSLNRWEVAEKQREEERRAKLAALNNRTLKGPVITFWSGTGDWGDGREGQGGAYHISIAEKPAKKKRLKAAEKEREKEREKEEEKKAEEKKDGGASSPAPASTSNPEGRPPPAPGDSTATADTQAPTQPTTAEAKDTSPQPSLPTEPSPNTASGLHAPSLHQDPPAKPENRAPLMAPPSMEPKLVPMEDATPKSAMALPAVETASGPQSSVLAAPVLAPPAGLSPTGLADESYSAPSSPKSNVLAPPNTTQRPSPLSLPPSTPAGTQSKPSKPPGDEALAPKPTETSNPDSILSQPHNASETKPPEGQSSGEANASRTRSAMILQNFNEAAIKDKSIQTQILFGRKMSKLQKPQPPPLCAITNQPARYRDPKTGLPYYNAYAYREIRRLARGEFRWSALLGCWVGDGTAAKGVPARFVDPQAPAPAPKEKDGDGKGQEKTGEGSTEGRPTEPQGGQSDPAAKDPTNVGQDGQSGPAKEAEPPKDTPAGSGEPPGTQAQSARGNAPAPVTAPS